MYMYFFQMHKGVKQGMVDQLAQHYSADSVQGRAWNRVQVKVSDIFLASNDCSFVIFFCSGFVDASLKVVQLNLEHVRTMQFSM
jgi:hypothetical protein